jgi:hypothetical protein
MPFVWDMLNFLWLIPKCWHTAGKEFIPNINLIPEKLAHLGYTPLLFKH